MKNASLRNFHLPIPAPVQVRLREAAEREGVPATVVARRALEEWLRDRDRRARAEQIGSYAAAVAGSRADLDPALEAASIEDWLNSGRRSR